MNPQWGVPVSTWKPGHLQVHGMYQTKCDNKAKWPSSTYLALQFPANNENVPGPLPEEREKYMSPSLQMGMEKCPRSTSKPQE